MGKILIFILDIFFLSSVIFVILPPDNKSLYPEFKSFDITDRNGILLRRVLSKDYRTGIWKDLREISPHMIKATIIREDKRFLLHNGVDFLALIRAIYNNLKYHRLTSGGSTITMQVAKIVLNHRKRTLINKIIEILYAIKLEIYLEKTKILEIYLNRAPYGYQTYGVEAASQFYFHKPASDLSLSESCILSVIPKSPYFLNPFKNLERLKSQRDFILSKLYAHKYIDSMEYNCALAEPVKINKQTIIFKAPHFVDFILQKDTEIKYSQITSTVSLSLQENIEKFLFTSIKTLSKYNVNQCAVVVMDTKTGEILAMVGSKDYFEEKEGQVNGCLALRQPGSSLKPFLYILALSNGIPMSYLMNDTVTEFRLSDGTVFAPRNFGEKYHRYVRAREALASSFNVPAVHLLDILGVENFYNFLQRLHFSGLYKQPNFYGLSLSLGASEVKLLELTNAYRAIANKGVWTGYKFIKDDRKKIGERVFAEEVAYIITDVLSDNSSRIKAFGDDSPLNLPFPCAVKTGTTKNFKDNWCVGFTEKYTVGVWVGNFDGSPMNGVSGISGAAPLFRDIMIELHRNEYPKEFEKPNSIIQLKVCARTGLIASKECPILEEIFIYGTEPKDTCHYCTDKRDENIVFQTNPKIKNKVLTIMHPRDGDIFKLDPHISYKNQAIPLKVSGDTNIRKIILRLNGKLLCERRGREVVFMLQPRPGEYEVEATGISTKTTIMDRVKYTVY